MTNTAKCSNYTGFNKKYFLQRRIHIKNNKIKKFFGRTLSVILTVFLLVGTIPIVGVSAAENEVEYKYFLNVNDVTYLQMHIAGKKNTDGSAFIDETNKQLFDCVDMNKDGKLSVADVTALQIQISQNN